MYGKSVKSNLLLSIANDDGVIPVILLFIFLIVAVVQVPIIFFNGKEALMAIISEAVYKTYSNIMNKDKISKGIDHHVPNEYVVDHEHDDHHNESHHIDHHETHHFHNPETHFDIKVASNQIVQDEENHEDHSHDVPHHIDNIKVIPDANGNQVVGNNQPADALHADASHQQEYLKYIKWHTYYPVTIFVYLIVILLSIVVGDVKLFFGLLGSIVSCFFAIAAPGTFYVIAIHKLKLKIDTPFKVFLYVGAWIYAVVGYIHVIGLTICVILVNV